MIEEHHSDTLKAPLVINKDIKRKKKKGNTQRDNKGITLDDEKQDKKVIPYDYPVNIVSQLLFSWTTNLLRIARKKQLKKTHLGNFAPELSPSAFLKEILPKWEEFSKTSKNPLITSLLGANIFYIILIFFMSTLVAGADTMTIILFRQILLHFEVNRKEEPYFSLLNTVLIMLIDKLFYIFFFRFFEFYTTKIGAKITIQVNTLLYEKLLKMSAFAPVSQGELIDFIQIDAEKFADFFSYTSATLVLPFQIAFFIYLLFQYFGMSFLVGIGVLFLILFFSSYLETLKISYQKKLLKLKDRRMKTTSQAFEMIKIIKLYSWEDYYDKKIKEERRAELEVLKQIEMITLYINSLFWSTGAIVSLISITVYNLFNTQMEVSNMLTSIYIFNNLGEPMFLFPEYVSGLLDSLVSLHRLEGFLNGRDANINQIDKNSDRSKYAVKINNLDFGIIKNIIEDDEKDKKSDTSSSNESEESDDEEEEKNEEDEEETELEKIQKPQKPQQIQEITIDKEKKTETIKLLKNINLKVPKADCLAIVGDVGSGKTCLLNAILNNLDILGNDDTKKLLINGSFAYVSQNPWILNDTLRGNITFFKDFEEEKYNHIVDICQLKPDFQILLRGDFTEIGDKGVNLSGGQKTRIALARAVYSDADIYIFDDPLSALDAFVGMNIFNLVIQEYLKNKTVIFATHALQYIPYVKHVVHMDNGQIDFYGSAEEAVQKDFFKKYVHKEKVRKNSIVPSNQPLMELVDTEFETAHHEDKVNEYIEKAKKKTIHKLTREDVQSRDEENRLVVYQNLFSYSGGVYFLILVVLINIYWKASEFSSDYIITIWSLQETLTKEQNMIYLYIYSAISILAIIFIFVRTLIVVGGIIKYNKKMHDVLLTRLLQAPINLFHDVVPRGQVLNRLSKDLDNSIRFFWTFNSTFRLFFQLLSCVFVSILFNWWSIFFFPIMVIIDYNIFNFYIKGGRDLNHLEGGTRSPIISGFSETLNGITSIRGFGFQDNFRKKYHSRLNDFYRVLIYQNGCTSWFALNIDLVSFCLLFIVLTFAIIFKNYVSPDAIGLLLTYTLKLIDFTYSFFEQYTLFERLLASIERCDSFTHIVQEAPSFQKGDENLRKIGFPQYGKLSFVSYSARYRPDTELALKNLNLEIKPHEKIGVVGRTGSGKSTLCLCVFRILEASTGKILIDDIDISKIGLKLLREIITVIPQDPTLIEGTLKDNLDPIHRFTEEEIEQQMKEIGLENMLKKKNGLKYKVSEGGLNLSVGERQLICIARAIMRKSKIIIMDEATSSIDYKTETLIQKSLEKSLKNSTVITIAHRIKTIINYDRIIVLQSGELIEQGSPRQLINSKKGTFYELYMQSNL